jgi:hypothetical protein
MINLRSGQLITTPANFCWKPAGIEKCNNVITYAYRNYDRLRGDVTCTVLTELKTARRTVVLDDKGIRLGMLGAPNVERTLLVLNDLGEIRMLIVEEFIISHGEKL